MNAADIAAGIGHVLGIAHFGQASEACVHESHCVGLDKIDGPSIAGPFLKCGEGDRLAGGQLEIGQGDHGTYRVAADAKGVVIDEMDVVIDRIVGVNAVGLAVAPAELDDQVRTDRLGQAGGVALVGVILESGGDVVVGVEQPMVVVAVLHPLGGVID